MPIKIDQKTINNLKVRDKEYDIRDIELKGFLVRIQKSGASSYVYNYRNRLGKNRRFTIGRTTEIQATKARQIAKQLALQVASGKDPVEDRRQDRIDAEKQKYKTLKRYFEDRYTKYIKTQHRDAAGSLSRLNKFVAIWGDLQLDAIDVAKLNNYREERIANGIAPSTLNRELNCLRGLFRLAFDENYIDINPFSKIKSLKIDKNPIVRHLTAEEETTLIAELEKRQCEQKKKRVSGNLWRADRGHSTYEDINEYRYTDYLLPCVILAIKTGMRRGELLKLKWVDIILDGAKSQVMVKGINSKNAQSRVIPLNEEAQTTLKEWKRCWITNPSKNDLVFPNPQNGKQMKEIGSAWDRVLKRAEINDFRFHDLRHTFASKLAINGVDLYRISKLMGHSDISMTQRYAHLLPDHMEDCVAKI